MRVILCMAMNEVLAPFVAVCSANERLLKEKEVTDLDDGIMLGRAKHTCRQWLPGLDVWGIYRGHDYF